MIYDQYSVVRITALHKTFTLDDAGNGSKVPTVGDVATVVEVYSSPTLGYELECIEEGGHTCWLATFAPEDATLELIHAPQDPVAA